MSRTIVVIQKMIAVASSSGKERTDMGPTGREKWNASRYIKVIESSTR